MIRYPEAPGWDLTITLVGTCHHCGADLSGKTLVRATTEWVNRYHQDAMFKSKIDHAISRIATARHDRECVGQRIEPRLLARWATSA